MEYLKEYYPVMVCGATFAGLGAAQAAPDECLVVERTALVGYEFINSYNPGKVWNETAVSDAGAELKRELVNRNILTDDKVHLPAIAPVLYNHIHLCGLNLLLMTEIIDINKINSKYVVKIYNASGIKEITAGSIIDTTCSGISVSPRKNRILSKSINAVVYCEGKHTELPVVEDNRVALVQGRFPGEVVMKLRLDIDDNWTRAREKLHRFWASRPDSMKKWTIAALASAFELNVDKGPFRVMKNWDMLPSSGFSNPLQSFEGGFSLVEGRFGK